MPTALWSEVPRPPLGAPGTLDPTRQPAPPERVTDAVEGHDQLVSMDRVTLLPTGGADLDGEACDSTIAPLMCAGMNLVPRSRMANQG